jgi:hypothetical protein
MRRLAILFAPLVAPLLLPAAGCDVPQDGTLQIAFLLETPPPGEARTLPPQAETGLPPAAFGQARGRCDCDVPARSVRCTFEALPPAGANGEPLSYRLRFLLWYAPLPARFDATALDRDPGGRDPDAPPPPMVPPLPRVVVGPVTPDAFGKAERTLAAADLPLARVAGGELQLLTDPTSADPTAHLILDGRVGNLPLESGATGTSTPPPPAGGGHVH